MIMVLDNRGNMEFKGVKMKGNYKFVFIGLDSIENKYLYGGFDDHSYSTAIFLPNFCRKVAKAWTIYGNNQSKIKKTISFLYFDRFIKTKINQLGWKVDDNIIFIIYSWDYDSYGHVLTQYLRSHFSNGKLVCYFIDLIKRHNLIIEEVRKQFDLLVTFDEVEAEKYGMSYCLEPFSMHLLKEFPRNREFKWDITLVASAKDRYEQIIKAFGLFTSKGFICDFHITQVPERERLYSDKIHYGSLAFEEVLSHVVQSRCVLELIQNNAYSPTTRFSESMLLNRNLLTNAPYFKEKKDIFPNVIFFENLEDIPFDRVKNKLNNVSKNYEDFFSEKRMMETILSNLP